MSLTLTRSNPELLEYVELISPKGNERQPALTMGRIKVGGRGVGVSL